MTDEARTILTDYILGSLATVNADGSPWSTPIHVFSDSKAVYWFSKQRTQHSENIERDGRVCVTLFSPDTSQGPKGVYFIGAAAKLDVENTAKAKKLIEAKMGKIPQNFVEATGYRLEIGRFNSGKSTGNCWYFYS